MSREEKIFSKFHCTLDLESVKQNWERILRLKPLPLVGSARWSKADSYALEQIIYWFDDDW